MRTCGGSTGCSSTPPSPITFCPLRERCCTRPGLAIGWGLPSPLSPSSFRCWSILRWPRSTTFLAGILGVFIAILVTAPMVPQTFEPGAIDLLLSKPVSRSLLFLTKFFGASTFILLNSIYLIGGMWLIAGLRFDIWSGRLLLCIPVFLFLFVIYYSVSALTGVIWRNAIVSVCCTILFWGLCFAVGMAKSLAENTFLDPTRLAAVMPAGDKLLAVNKSGQTFEWSTVRKAWEEISAVRTGAARSFSSANGSWGQSTIRRAIGSSRSNRSRRDSSSSAGRQTACRTPQR